MRALHVAMVSGLFLAASGLAVAAVRVAITDRREAAVARRRRQLRLVRGPVDDVQLVRGVSELTWQRSS